MKKEIINLGFGLNNNFIHYLAALLESIFENNTKYKFKIFIFYDSKKFSKQNINKLKKYIKEKKQIILFYEIPEDYYKGLKLIYPYSKETYFKIFAPKVLEKKINKLLYLDGDMITLGSIEELWKTKFEGKPLCAVKDCSTNEYYVKEFGNKPYFNAGALLIDIKEWNYNNYSNKIKEFMINNPQKIIFADQDGLNFILNNKWKYLNEKWNYIAIKGKPKKIPRIVHFAGCKPNSWKKELYCNDKFFYYLKKTPWKDFIYKQYIIAIPKKIKAILESKTVKKIKIKLKLNH